MVGRWIDSDGDCCWSCLVLSWPSLYLALADICMSGRIWKAMSWPCSDGFHCAALSLSSSLTRLVSALYLTWSWVNCFLSTTVTCWAPCQLLSTCAVRSSSCGRSRTWAPPWDTSEFSQSMPRAASSASCLCPSACQKPKAALWKTSVCSSTAVKRSSEWPYLLDRQWQKF